MRAQQAATALAVLAAMSIGSVVNDRLHDPDEVLARPYQHHATVGEDVPMRTLSVTVHGVSGAAKVRSYGKVAGSHGMWLVVDLSFTSMETTEGLAHGVIVTTDGRRFGGSQAVPLSCGVSLPGIVHGCQQLFELPKGVLAGARFEVPTDGGTVGDDLAVIDLGIDQAKAAQLEASTAVFDAEKAGS